MNSCLTRIWVGAEGGKPIPRSAVHRARAQAVLDTVQTKRSTNSESCSHVCIVMLVPFFELQLMEDHSSTFTILLFSLSKIRRSGTNHCHLSPISSKEDTLRYLRLVMEGEYQL